MSLTNSNSKNKVNGDESHEQTKRAKLDSSATNFPEQESKEHCGSCGIYSIPNSITVSNLTEVPPSEYALDNREFHDGYSCEQLFNGEHAGYTYDDLIMLPGVDLNCCVRRDLFLV